MKDNYTHITFVLDKSGSMDTLQNDTIGGFNRFVEDQKKVAGEATMTLVLFDTVYDVRHSGLALASVPALDRSTYIPSGCTALHDAVGRAIRETGIFLRDKPEEQRPSKVVFVILTDGEENSSHETTLKQIQEMIKVQTDQFKWQFVYLGVGIDAFVSGAQLGIPKSATANVAAQGQNVGVAYAAMSRNLADVRTGVSCCCCFTEHERKTMGGIVPGPSASQPPDPAQMPASADDLAQKIKHMKHHAPGAGQTSQRSKI